MTRPADAKMMDLEDPTVGIEVSIRADGQVLWINVDGRCLLRICQIKVPIEITDDRSEGPY